MVSSIVATKNAAWATAFDCTAQFSHPALADSRGGTRKIWKFLFQIRAFTQVPQFLTAWGWVSMVRAPSRAARSWKRFRLGGCRKHERRARGQGVGAIRGGRAFREASESRSTARPRRSEPKSRNRFRSPNDRRRIGVCPGHAVIGRTGWGRRRRLHPGLVVRSLARDVALGAHRLRAARVRCRRAQRHALGRRGQHGYRLGRQRRSTTLI